MAPLDPLPPLNQAHDWLLSRTCGECGSLIGSVQKHTAWHAGAGQDDARTLILGFLDSIDPAQLSQAALNVDDVDDPIVAALTILKQAAASLP